MDKEEKEYDIRGEGNRKEIGWEEMTKVGESDTDNGWKRE